MSFLLAFGAIGGMVYGTYLLKKETQSIVADYKTKPNLQNANMNKERLANQFCIICQRCDIKLKDGRPINDNNINVAIEYLRYQGYTETEIDQFKKQFYEELEEGKKQQLDRLKLTNKRLMYSLLNRPADNKIILRRTIYVSDLSPEERMNTLLKNRLWNRIVDNHSYVHSRNGLWQEIWTLKVPNDFFKNISKEKLYENVCKIQGVEYTI